MVPLLLELLLLHSWWLRHVIIHFIVIVKGIVCCLFKSWEVICVFPIPFKAIWNRWDKIWENSIIMNCSSSFTYDIDSTLRLKRKWAILSLRKLLFLNFSIDVTNMRRVIFQLANNMRSMITHFGNRWNNVFINISSYLKFILL